jgi:hypothetical protein
MAKSSNNVLAIGVGLNLDPLNNDIKQAANTAKDGMETIGNSISSAGAKADKPLRETKDKLISLSSQLRQARLDAQQLALGGKELGEAFQASVAKAAALKDQIAAVDNEILKNTQTINSQGQPAFQAAKSGYNGMAMSINQLTREMPAFTYSMQTGFMAISNNIPMFVDQINAAKRANMDLIASGQPVKSVFSQVASSLFSMQTLMGVGITILTVYGAKIYEALVGHDKSAESIKKEAEEQKKLSQAQDEAWASLVRLNNERVDGSIAHNSIVSLYTRTLKDGLDKDLQNNKIALANELLNNQKAYNERKITYQQANEAEKLIRIFYANEAIRITDEFNKKEAEKAEKINNEKKVRAEKNSRYLVELNKWEIEENARNIKLAEDKAKLAPRLAAMQQPMVPKLSGSGYDFGASKNPNLDLTFGINEVNIAAAAEKIKQQLQSLNNQIKSIIDTTIVQTFTGIGEMIGNAIVGNISDPFAALGDILLGSLASLAQQLGAQMIAFGVAQLAFETSIASLNPIGAIAAGTAMVAIGAVIKSLNQGGTKKANTGGRVGAPSVATSSFIIGTSGSYYNGGSSDNGLRVTGKIAGRDIVISNNQTLRAQGRSTNIG